MLVEGDLGKALVHFEIKLGFIALGSSNPLEEVVFREESHFNNN